MPSTKKAAPVPSTITSEPVAPKPRRRRLRASVISPILAATVTTPAPTTPPVGATPVAPPSGTTSATDPQAAAPSDPTIVGTRPVISQPVVSLPPIGTTTPATAGAVGMPPDASVPSVPNGYVAVSPRAYQGYHPTAKELVAAPAAMADLERFVDYTAAFGSLVPSPEAITAALTSGVAWRALLGPSNEWNEYVKGQNGMAWKYALTLLDELKPAFLTAVAKNRALAQKYPGLYALLEAPREVAKQGLATKKKNGKTKAVATASAAQAAETSVAAPVAATPVRTVTVSG